MKINKINKKKNGMYTVTLEDNNKITVHEDLILKYDLLIKKEIDDSLKEEILEENKIYEVYEISVNYINKRLRSIKELSNYLSKKEYSEDIISNVIELLINQGYLDDKRYATSYVNDRINLSVDGPNKTRKYLEDNNIDSSIIEEAMLNYSSDLEEDRIEKLVNKQIKLNKNKGSNLLKRKIQMYLLNLGYDYDKINKSLNSKNLSNPDLYKKEYDKLYRELSKKYSGKELEYRLKQKLYQKGFTNEDY